MLKKYKSCQKHECLVNAEPSFHWSPFVRIFVYTREIQMKTLIIFYLIIYWIQKVHNNFIFLRSLQCVQYKCSSVSEVHGCLYKKNSFGWERSHSCTACWASSSDLKDLPPIACLSGPTYMKITVGEVWRVWRMWKTLEGQILDCCNSWTGSMGPSIVMLQ